MALPKKAPPKPLDPAELPKLSPPLSLMVNKIYFGGTKPMRIDLPSARNDPGFGPGEGYTHEDVKEIHRLLELKWGGGTYYITVTDTSSASLVFMVWLDERNIPDKVPAEKISALQDAASAPSAAASAAGLQSPEEWMARQTPGVPRHEVARLASVPPANGTPSPTAVDLQRREEDTRQRVAEARTLEERLRAAEQQAQILREQAQQRDYQIQLEKAEAAHRRELEELRRDRVAAPVDGVKEMLAAMMARMDKQEQETRMRLDRQEASQREGGQTQLLTTMMNMQSESTKTMIAMMSAKPSGIDPTVAMVIESSKQQAEMFKEQLRAVTDQMRERDRTALSAKDVIEITREAQKSSGGVEMVKTMTEITGAVVAMAKNAMDLNPGSQPHPVAEVIGNVFEKASTGFKEWVGAQRDVAVGQQRVMEAQAHAAGRMTPQGPPPQRPAPPPPAPAQPMTDAERVAKAAADLDLQRFGPAVEAIARLRKGVAAGAITPEKCIDWLKVAITESEKLGWNVPALGLLEEHRLDEFIRWVLPVVEPPFRQELSERLTKFCEEEDEE